MRRAECFSIAGARVLRSGRVYDIRKIALLRGPGAAGENGFGLAGGRRRVAGIHYHHFFSFEFLVEDPRGPPHEIGPARGPPGRRVHGEKRHDADGRDEGGNHELDESDSPLIA